MLHRFVTWPTWWLGERRWSGRCGKSRSRSSSTRSDCLTTSCSAVSPWDEQTVNRFACGSFHMNFAFMLVNLASRRCVPSAFSGLQVRKLHVTNCNRLQFVTCWDILYWIIKVCFCTHDFWCGVWSFLYICTQQLFAELIERPSVGDVLQATSSRSFWISLMATLIARGNFGERRAEIRMWLAHRSCSSSYSQVWFVLSNKSAQC